MRLLTHKIQTQDQRCFMPAEHGIVVLIDPPSYHYYQNEFFNLSSELNRDDVLKTNFEIKSRLETLGIPVFTADHHEMVAKNYKECCIHYWSFGAPATRALKICNPEVKKIGIALFEPPLVKARDYLVIADLVESFEQVFLHNTLGDGYEMPNHAYANKIRKLYWTNRNYGKLGEGAFFCRRYKSFALIAGSHLAKAASTNGYGKRLAAIEILGAKGLDLYGAGWGRFQIRSPIKSLFWKYRLRSLGFNAHKFKNKTEVYQQYDFALCFENMAMAGYEKIFDAFSGCIPIYWELLILEYIQKTVCPTDSFPDIQSCLAHCMSIRKRKSLYRLNIHSFLKSKKYELFNSGIHGAVIDCRSKLTDLKAV